MKQKIAIILPRGEAIKNFVYSGITDELRKDFIVDFFSVVPNLEIKKYLQEKCDRFYELSPEKEAFDKKAQQHNEILKIAHAKKLNSVTGNLKLLKDDLMSKKNIKSNIIRRFRKLLAGFYTSEESLRILTNKFVEANYNHNNVLHYEALLKESKPDIVFNASHIHNPSSYNLLYAVKKLGLKTATFLFSWDNLTSQGRIIPEYDYYFTWNEKIKKDLLRIYPFIKSDEVFVTGTPQFDFHFKDEFLWKKGKLYEFLNIPKHKKIVLYSTGMAYYVPKESIIVEEIDKVLQEIDEDLQLVVRIYAKDDNTPYYVLKEKNKRINIPDHFWELNYMTPTFKDLSLFNSLLNHCELGINVASTVSLDLAVLNKPVINIAFNPPNVDIYPNNYEKIYEFDHYKPIIASGAIALARSPQELKTQIQQYLNDKTTHEKERAQLIANFFGSTLKANKLEKFSNIFKQIV